MNIYRGRPAHLPDDGEELAADVLHGLDDEPIVIVQLSNRVQDGTRCRTGSLDMCIQGKCQVCVSSIYNVHVIICLIYIQCFVVLK